MTSTRMRCCVGVFANENRMRHRVKRPPVGHPLIASCQPLLVTEVFGHLAAAAAVFLLWRHHTHCRPDAYMEAMLQFLEKYCYLCHPSHDIGAKSLLQFVCYFYTRSQEATCSLLLAPCTVRWLSFDLDPYRNIQIYRLCLFVCLSAARLWFHNSKVIWNTCI